MQDFGRYKTLIDSDIAERSQVLTERWQREFGLESAQVLDSYLSVLSRGGKRLRGSLGMWAYAMTGGNDDVLAIHAARALEMIHAYLLVVDDVADQATARRGGPSAHTLLASCHETENWFGDAQQFGQMQAINAGLAAQHLVMQEVAELASADSTKLDALRELSAILFKTVAGQIADLNHQAMRDVSESEILTMMTQKTAYYSFVSPLEFGIILAGKDWSDYAWLEQWAENIGLSFQIRDDCLGVFGDEKATGKSNSDDLREGKMTLLVARALAHGDEQQKADLLQLLGKKDLSTAELEQAQTIIEDTGALAYARTLGAGFAEKAVASLDKAPPEHKVNAVFLKELSLNLLNRHS